MVIFQNENWHILQSITVYYIKVSVWSWPEESCSGLICVLVSQKCPQSDVTSVTTLCRSDVIRFFSLARFPQATTWYAVATTVVWPGSIWTCPRNRTKFSGESARAGFYNLGSLGQTRGKLLLMLALSDECLLLGRGVVLRNVPLLSGRWRVCLVSLSTQASQEGSEERGLPQPLPSVRVRLWWRQRDRLSWDGLQVSLIIFLTGFYFTFS